MTHASRWNDVQTVGWNEVRCEMGVDFKTCDKCAGTFPDCGPYAMCNDCHRYLCPNCMDRDGAMYDVAELSGEDLEYALEDSNVDSKDDLVCCPFCDDRIVTDEQLLNFVLRRLDISRDRLIADYRQREK